MKDLIKSYTLYENENGIIELVINTSEAFPRYQTTDDHYIYYIGDSPNTQLFEIDPFLDKDQVYVVTETQERNQLFFYFIPRKIYLSFRFKN